MNLIEVLTQPDHSGILEGNCRVHFERNGHNKLKEYLKGPAVLLSFKITFSIGIQALGTYNFEAIRWMCSKNIVGGNLVFSKEEKLSTKEAIFIHINLNTGLKEHNNCHKFTAIISKNLS